MLNQIELQTGIVLLSSKVLMLCFDTLKPALEPVLLRLGQEAAQAELQDPPSGQQEPGQDDAGGTESCLKLPPSWTMRNEQDEAEHDLTELQARLMALRLPVHAEAHQPRSLRFWGVADATMRTGGLPRTTPDNGLFEVLVPEATEQARTGSHMSCGI